MSLFRFDDGSFYPFTQEQEDALDRRIARLRSFGAGLFLGGLIGVLTGWGSAALADTAGPFEMLPMDCGIVPAEGLVTWFQPPAPPLPVRETILREPEPPIRVTPHVPYIPGGNDPHIPAPVSLPAAGFLSLLALGSLALLRRKS